MKTLSIKNEKGTTFNYSKDGEFTLIEVVKESGEKASYKTYSGNTVRLAKEGKLSVCRENGSWVDMPVCEVEKVVDFMKGREKVSFSSIEELRAFEKGNSIGKFWENESGFSAYTYV